MELSLLSCTESQRFITRILHLSADSCLETNSSDDEVGVVGRTRFSGQRHHTPTSKAAFNSSSQQFRPQEKVRVDSRMQSLHAFLSTPDALSSRKLPSVSTCSIFDQSTKYNTSHHEVTAPTESSGQPTRSDCDEASDFPICSYEKLRTDIDSAQPNAGAVSYRPSIPLVRDNPEHTGLENGSGEESVALLSSDR
ncbi:unnamed protein product [Protopolystoma xenopodis]|uniref:Uncharacterized protein n=1 Tax=Protopolystoma xenopodis TaxID=117903 RepID=A0A3S5CTJ9_9PLAT|nr:unnamed protein product [Protopolystoma xenopodis]